MPLLKALGNALSSLATMYIGRQQALWQKKHIDNSLSGSQLQAFELNAQEAQKARDWNLDVDNTKYQRQVADMQAAGVNPALAMSGGVSTQAATAATGEVGSGYNGALDSGVSAVANLMSQIANINFERKRLQIQERVADSEVRLNDSRATGQNIRNEVDAKTALRKAEADIKEVWHGISRDDAMRKQAEAQTAYLREVTEKYPELSDSIVAMNLSRVGLNEAQASVADVTYSRILSELSWMPSIYAAQIANYYASAGYSQEQAKYARWSTFRTVTWSEAQSMGIKLPFSIGVSESISKNTPVSIIASADGKGYEVVSIGVEPEVPKSIPVPVAPTGDTLDNTD